MALKTIPTWVLPEIIVDTLPSVGEEGKVYRRLVEDEALREMQITDDFIWHDGEWLEFSFDAKVYGPFFKIYMDSVSETIAELEQRVKELEGGGGSEVLYIDRNIALTEGAASIEKTISVATDIVLHNGSEVKITLEGMTVDGEPISDVTETIALYDLNSWDWRGGEVYSDVFGNSAYFSFGTKPIDGAVNQITLGFTNEQEHFDPRTLVIGHIKVEVV